ncbi:MAG: tetratricopeptide repeat protein [Planctomycetota bacterium]|nr:MAG: tetratricopeptide repeat protein [Planctomycetota bacterium]
MVDPVTAGLIGWVCGKLADRVLKSLVSDRKLAQEVDNVVAEWAKSLPKDRYVHPKALFPEVDTSTGESERPEYCGLQAELVKNKLPSKEMWHAVFMESWRWVRDNLEETQSFFQLEEPEASEELERLAEATYNVCVQHEPVFKRAVIGKLDGIEGKIDGIGEYMRGRLKREVESLWPGVSLPLAGPKVSEPFAGRKEELEELTRAMGGEKTVVAVVGMAGQGKSCLVGEWYKRGARPGEGVGLFWRKVYEAGYTFDRFVDELYLYLTGEEIDRKRINTVEARTEVVEAALKERPCWIVLDGVERWLNRWAAEPDAGVEDLTVDDRSGQEAVLDKFLKGACFWENGSRLLLTTRAVPSAFDENPPLMIGEKHGQARRLASLREEEAVGLLDDLGVRGEKATMQEAARAYGCHPYAVHVLGVLIRDLYGGDASKWGEVNPLEETKLGGLFQRIIEDRGEDLGLLQLVASSVGPAPVEMLAELSGEDEGVIRKKLAELGKWQMAEFEGEETEQHTVVRQYLQDRMGRERTRALRRQIAAWWAERKVPARPVRIEEVRPLLKAVEHLIGAGEPRAAGRVLYRKWSGESYYILNEWVCRFGYLEESIRINSLVIRGYVRVIEKGRRRELRRDLAVCYDNRGNALWNQGKLDEAIADYGRAIVICEELVEREGRLELRNDLAMSYNNRGGALIEQGKLDDAIGDYGRAIAIIEEVVEKEGRLELRNNLATCYNNQGIALSDRGKLDEAIADYGRAIAIYKELVETEGSSELRRDLAMAYNNRWVALWRQGRLDQAIEDLGRAIAVYKELVEKEGRRELRHDLAACYDNRGIALAEDGKLGEAVEDHGRAIEIYAELVRKEGRRELRKGLATSYSNRGASLRGKGEVDEAIGDYGRAIVIREQLVEKEGRRELRSDLGGSLYNRALARGERNEWGEARADIEKGGGLLVEVIEEGQRHVIGSFVKAAGFRCQYAEELGDIKVAAEWANRAMRWFLEEVEGKRASEILLREAGGFAVDVGENLKVLSREGLDEKLFEKVLKALGEERKGRSKE